MKHRDFAKVMGWLGYILRCPVCNIKYNMQNVRVLESEHSEGSSSGRLLIHSDCSKCKSSVMFNIDISGSDIFTVAAITDLTSSDSARFSDLSPINANDCIEIHKTLKKFNGDFIKALT